MQNNKIKVLYINSSSASGSTLLEALLSTQPDVYSLGEIGVLGEWLNKDKLCSCGKPVSECDVWSKLDQDLVYGNTNDELSEYMKNTSFVSRWVMFFYLIFFPPGRKMQERIIRYAKNAENTFNLYVSLQHPGSSKTDYWVVDSTKSHWRLQWLELSGLFDIQVIHLVKDPRAYVHSMDKVYKGRKKQSRMATQSATKLAYRWLSANFAIMILHRLRFRRNIRTLLRYDQLAGDYLNVLKNITNFMGVYYNPESAMNFRTYKDHAIGGNAMRMENRPVQLDSQWQTGMGQSRSEKVWLIAWPLAILFGFRKNYNTKN